MEFQQIDYINKIHAYPELPDDLKLYVKKQLNRLNLYIRGPPGIDSIVDMYRSIRAGGSGSFTNKIDKDGMIRLSDSKLLELINRVYSFYSLTSMINDEIKDILNIDYNNYNNPCNYIKIYRAVDFIDEPPNKIIQPIPASCSWDINFPLFKWGGTDQNLRKKILEIIIRKDLDFLPTSYPGDLTDIKQKININNQEQLEVLLPPCILNKIGERKELVTIYTYIVEPFNKDNFKQDGIFKILKE